MDPYNVCVVAVHCASTEPLVVFFILYVAPYERHDWVVEVEGAFEVDVGVVGAVPGTKQAKAES